LVSQINNQQKQNLNMKNKSLEQEINNIIQQFNLNCTFENFQDKVDWCYISCKQKLSEDFIREFQEKVNWNYISACQKLSEGFIREFQEKVNWISISTYQKLSEEFIREFQEKVNWISISAYQKLSEDFIREFQEKLDLQKIKSDSNWLYKTGDEKLEIVRNTELYEIDGDYVIAYKSTKWDGSSAYKPTFYIYEVDGIYESNADYNCLHENSHGLSAWTKEKAYEYNNQKLFKIKVHKDDLSACVHNGGKLRCSKIEIIEHVHIEN